MQTLTEPSSEGDRPAPSLPRLKPVVLAGRILSGGEPAVVLRPGQTLWLGRGMSDEPCIQMGDDDYASQQHASITCALGSGAGSSPRLWLEDARSKNGTYVNGRPVFETELRDQDVVRIGSSFFVVLLSARVPRQPEAPQGPLLGSSDAIEAVRLKLRQYASGAATVLIYGETGTGKELAAQLLHQQSGRKGRLIAVNCAAIPESLAESEFFGHTAGAFTGATRANQGRFLDARGGTLFLDEMGELPLGIQAKLLRVLQDRRITPVGTGQSFEVDVRIVAATNRDLLQETKRRRFRQDLFERLNGVSVTLPPLRRRREDILPLLRHFMGRAGELRITRRAADLLLVYSFPGNVRELEQLGRGTLGALPSDSVIDHRLIEEKLRTEPPLARSAEVESRERLSPEPPRGEITRERLISVLVATRGNLSDAQRRLGKHRRTLRRYMEEWNITSSLLSELLAGSGGVRTETAEAPDEGLLIGGSDER